MTPDWASDGSTPDVTARWSRPGKSLDDPAEQILGGVVFRIPDDPGLDTQTLRQLPLGNAVLGVIRALAMDVRTKGLEERPHGSLLENHDIVYRLQRGHELRPASLVQDRTARALELPHRVVPVDGDHEHIALLRGSLEIAHMADVQQIEASIRKHDSLALSAGRGKLG